MLAKADDRDAGIDVVMTRVEPLGIFVEPFDDGRAVVAAKVRRPARDLDVSRADRARPALTTVRSLPVPTDDRDWAVRDVGVTTRPFR